MTLATQFDQTRVARPREAFAGDQPLSRWLQLLGLGWIGPLLRMLPATTPKSNWWRCATGWWSRWPALRLFLFAWATLAPQVQTSLGAIPGPAQVWEQTVSLWADHLAERQKEADFYAKQTRASTSSVASGKADKVKIRPYTGQPTFIDQIFTSLRTVGLGFVHRDARSRSRSASRLA